MMTNISSSNISVMDQQTRAGRIFILERIRDQKHILFGRFTDSLKKHDKEQAWNKIAQDAISLGHFPHNRHGGYLRDTTWQNWRKRFVEKRDKKLEYERLGGVAGVGKKIEFDDADLLIADILGDKGGSHSSHNSNNHRWVVKVDSNNSQANNDMGGTHSTSSSVSSMFAHNFLEVDVKEDEIDQYYHNEAEESAEVVEEYNVDEDEEVYEQEDEESYPMGLANSDQVEIEDDTSNNDVNPPADRPERSLHNQVDSYCGSSSSVFLMKGSQSQRKRRAYSNEDNGDGESAGRASLLDKKLRLEVDLLEMEKYKRRLEILKLERHLGLPPSAITRDVLRKS